MCLQSDGTGTLINPQSAVRISATLFFEGLSQPLSTGFAVLRYDRSPHIFHPDFFQSESSTSSSPNSYTGSELTPRSPYSISTITWPMPHLPITPVVFQRPRSLRGTAGEIIFQD